MAKTRLTAMRRKALLDFAFEKISVPEQAAFDKSYAAVSRLVRADVEKKYPLKDMDVLRKYNTLNRASAVNGADPEGAYRRFRFHKPEYVLVPNVDVRGVPFSKATIKALDEYEEASASFKNAKAEKEKAYKALIYAAQYFEDVTDVWPAAETLRDQMGAKSTALTTLSAEVVGFIKADNAGAT